MVPGIITVVDEIYTDTIGVSLRSASYGLTLIDKSPGENRNRRKERLTGILTEGRRRF